MDEIFYYPARIIRAQGDLAQLFPSNEKLLARYRQRYPDSPVESPYFLKTEISNNSLDWYFTHMLTSSLQNYAQDADAGVSLQDSHVTMRLGYGRSLFGAYNSMPGMPPGWDRLGRRGDEGLPSIPAPTQYERVLSAAYVIPGVNMTGLTFASTDDFIRAIEAGSVEEISIGFGGGSESCDVCGMRYWSWDCPHIAGFVYDIEINGETSIVLATVSINNAHLFEYSAVYAGATPNAMVVRKAEQEAEAGRLTLKQAGAIEQRYRIKLPLARNWPGLERSNGMSGKRDAAEEEAPEEETTGAAETETPEPEGETMNELDQIRALLGETDAEGDSLIGKIRTLIGEVARLQPLADMGRQYRNDLIDAALAEGQRAQGDKFPMETYRGMLENASIEHIKSVRDAFAEQARQRLPGGRQMVRDEVGEENPRPAGQRIPDEAYNV